MAPLSRWDIIAFVDLPSSPQNNLNQVEIGVTQSEVIEITAVCIKA